jgi:hypothetical protein
MPASMLRPDPRPRQTRWFNPNSLEIQQLTQDLGGRSDDRQPQQIRAKRKRKRVDEVKSPVSTSLDDPTTITLRPMSYWDVYWHLKTKVRQGGIGTLVRNADGDSFVIKEIPRAHKDKHLMALQTLASAKVEAFFETIEAYDWQDNLFVVSKHIMVSASHIISSYLVPSEEQIACIASQVSGLIIWFAS